MYFFTTSREIRNFEHENFWEYNFMHLNCQFCIKRQTKFETKRERNNFSADGKYEVRLMTKAELKYTGWK